jgi:hypothetical protein
MAGRRGSDVGVRVCVEVWKLSETRQQPVELAPVWRHSTFMAVCVLDKRSRQNLRLDPRIWDEVDRDRSRRAGNISRNTWITEAILEKLAREQPALTQSVQNSSRRSPHA